MMNQLSNISMNHIANKYVNFYKQMRKYIWDIETVSKLADLEISLYDRFANLAQLKSNLLSLKSCILSEYSEDDDLRSSFDALLELIKDAENSGMFAELENTVEGYLNED